MVGKLFQFRDFFPVDSNAHNHGLPVNRQQWENKSYQYNIDYPGKYTRRDPANPAWDPGFLPGGIPPILGGIPPGIPHGTSRVGSHVGFC